jgi:hypothetical protein
MDKIVKSYEDKHKIHNLWEAITRIIILEEELIQRMNTAEQAIKTLQTNINRLNDL